MKNVEPDALLKGGAAAIVVCLPLAIVAAIIDTPGDQSPWVVPLFVGVILGFAVGGFVAARVADDFPYTNGGVAALTAFVVIQGVGILIRLLGDDPVHYVTAVFNGLLAYGAGVTGGIAGSRNRA